MENTQALDSKYEAERKRKQILLTVFRYFIVLLFAAFILVPLYVVIITSFKTTVEANGTKFYWWPQQGFSLDGYIKIFSTNQVNRNLIRGFGVTLWMYVPPIIVGVFVSSMAAYGFAKMEFFLKKPLFAILMSSFIAAEQRRHDCVHSSIQHVSVGWVRRCR